MKNIKKITSYAIIMLAITHHCQIYTLFGNDPMLTAAVKMADEALTKQ